MNIKRLYICTLYILFAWTSINAGEELREITLQEAIERAREHSPNAIAARHAFRAAYWNWRSFKATLLPSLTLTSSPILNRSISSIPLEDGTETYVHKNQLTVDATLNINQNIPFTGGSLFVSTDLQRLDMFSDYTHAYKSTPVIVGYSQTLFGYNTLKWNQKIEPVRYREAKKELVETLELVAWQTTYLFFSLADAQSTWEMALYNYANADTLYQYAKGRYEIGTITENEMLQLELNLLSEQNNIMKARISMDDRILSLRSFIGMSEDIELIPVIEEDIPSFKIPLDEALELAQENSPDPESFRIRLLESESEVARAKAARGLKADLYMQVGLTQTDRHFSQVYRNAVDQQLIQVGIQIPIADWGVGKGKVRVATSNRDRIHTQVAQSRVDFEMNVVNTVKQFNLQEDLVRLARKKDRIAQQRNEVARKLYILGKSTILDLNAAITEKNSSRSNYIDALQKYWTYYYTIRSLTGYDFEHDRMLTEDYEYLMK